MTIDGVLRSVLSDLSIPQAELYLQPRFSAHENNHRLLLREAIYENLPHAFTRESRPKVLLLDHIPRPEGGYLSIVHCDGWGGYIFSPKPVGIDIEIASRIVPEIIERVSTPEEIKIAPSKILLWSGKEASFKSLFGFDQPQTVSSLILESWRQERKLSGDSTYHHFNVRRKATQQLIQGQGIAGTHGSYTWSLFTHDENKTES